MQSVLEQLYFAIELHSLCTLLVEFYLGLQPSRPPSSRPHTKMTLSLKTTSHTTFCQVVEQGPLLLKRAYSTDLLPLGTTFISYVEIWPPCWCGDAGAGMGAGIASLLWPATQFCIINRPAPGEQLGESIKEIKAIINPPSFFNILSPSPSLILRSVFQILLPTT